MTWTTVGVVAIHASNLLTIVAKGLQLLLK
jgi:hypothetical protein